MNDLVQLVTFAIAVLGFGLSIFNTVMAHLKDRIDLKVEPILHDGEHADQVFQITITNMGTRPVTVLDIGFRKRRKHFLSAKKNAQFISQGIIGATLPYRLEPLALTSVYYNQLPSEDTRDAYAKVAGGKVFYGTSPDLRMVIREKRARRQTA